MRNSALGAAITRNVWLPGVQSWKVSCFNL